MAWNVSVAGDLSVYVYTSVSTPMHIYTYLCVCVI